VGNGLCVLPAHAAQKRPTVPTWKAYQTRLPHGVLVQSDVCKAG
jgi:hypothetical protein